MTNSYEPTAFGGCVATATSVAPNNPLEQELARIWQDILEVPDIGVHDDFFDLGGHSLLAIEVRAQLRKKLNAPQLRVDLLDTPTIASLSESIFRQLAS